MDRVDFKGKLKKISPEFLIKQKKNDVVDNFFLVLAYIYNDLKGLTFFHIQISEKYRAPLPGEITYHSGEYGGYSLQLYRIVISTIHEFFAFLKENKKIFSIPKFYLIKNKLHPSVKKEWDDMVSIALGESLTSNDFTKTLLLIRNNVGFHYYDSAKNLSKGFVSRFFDKEKSELNGNLFAYYSLGVGMEDTRFFYADAAVQEYLFTIFHNTSNQERIIAVVHNMNNAISLLLKQYIQDKHLHK